MEIQLEGVLTIKKDNKLQAIVYNDMSKKPEPRTRVHRDNQRAKSVEKIIRKSWESLESHLTWTHHHSSEGRQFHKTCVKDYLYIMNEAVKLY